VRLPDGATQKGNAMNHAPHQVLPCKAAPKKKHEDHDKDDDQGKRHLKKHHHKHHHKHQHNCR
jgi:hypothetical protein